MLMMFDVAHADNEKLIRIGEDRQFLADQRGARKMTMGQEDKVFTLKEQKKNQRKFEEARRTEKQAQANTVTLVTDDEDNEVQISSSTDDESNVSESEITQISKYHRQLSKPVSSAASSTSVSVTPKTVTSKLNRRRLIDNPLFVASLDRTKTTPREAMHIVAPALKAVGVDVDKLTLCTTSLYEARKKVRCSISQNVRNTFSPQTPLVAHFDGKLLPDRSGVNADRMPIVVSGKDVEKLLAIPKLPGSGTGSLMGNAVVDILRQWTGVPEWLAGLCFDTTSSNTGIHNGAITVIQKAFHKRLLFLACRHHILEIVATAVFDFFFVSSGPKVAIFGRFKGKWPIINLADYSPICKDTTGFTLSDDEKMWLGQNSEGVAQFVVEQLLRTKQPRDDYSELLKLTLVALGEEQRIPGGVKFSPPGAYHRARWMAKGLYCLKILCFREQFKMNAHELQAIKRIYLFMITLYVKAWFTAPMTCDAPYNDLCLLQHIELFNAVDSQIAKVALEKIKGHMWYLSEDLAALSLFSDKVFANEKRLIVAALSTPAGKVDLRRVSPKSIECFGERALSQFVTKRSMNLFMALKLDQCFLSSDPDVWEARDDFKIAKKTVAAVRVVNDCAERAVKLATDYNMALTQDEEQRQLIFQVVEYHRKQITAPLKRKFKEI